MLNEGTQVVVVFDTNAYRQLTWTASPAVARERTKGLKTAEAHHHVQALAHTTVQMELLANLVTSRNDDYESALAAVVAMFEHCSQRSGDQKVLAIAVTSELQLCKSLYACQPPDLFGGHDVLRAMIKRVAEDPSESNLRAMGKDLEVVQRLTLEAERHFIDDIKKYVVQGLAPSAQDWNPLHGQPAYREAVRAYLNSAQSYEAFGRMLTLKAASLAGVEETTEGITAKGKWAADTFQVPIALFNGLVEKIATTGYDITKKKRGNTLWDIDVAFSIGEKHTFAGVPTRMVSTDTAIRDAAAHISSQRLVMTYGEYREALRSQESILEVRSPGSISGP